MARAPAAAEAGLEGLTLRRLAERLGIRAPTLYWHVRDKRELMDLIAGAVLEQALAGWREPQPGQVWWEWLAGRTRAMRTALLAHRDSALVLAGNRPVASSIPGIERQLRALTEAGFRPQDAVLALLSLNAFAIGEALDTQRETGRDAGPSGATAPGASPDPGEIPLLSAAIGALEPFGSSDQRFEYGLSLLITGLRTQHAGREQPPEAAQTAAREAAQVPAPERARHG
ncbi:MAG: TetR/AcrR family transcriptional regulator C-terminal domain-containing protein [Streptosporangiaceae bacterium]